MLAFLLFLWPFNIKVFFLVLEHFPEALCVFIFLSGHLCSRDSLSSVGMFLLCDFLSTPMFGLSRLSRPRGNAQSSEPHSFCLEGSAFLQHDCSATGSFLLLPPWAPPPQVGSIVLQEVKGIQWPCRDSISGCVETAFQAVLPERVQTGFGWQGPGFVKRGSRGVQGSSCPQRWFLLLQKAALCRRHLLNNSFLPGIS